jgi:hypothetical protein
MIDGINISLVICVGILGFLCGFLYYHYYWNLLCLRAVLVILWQIQKRGVFISSYDRAVIKIAHKAAGGRG